MVDGGARHARCDAPLPMTAPRQVLEGTTYLVTRRCSERRFFLRPSKATNAIVEYLLAVTAERYGIRIHAYCVLSNHYHFVLTDPHARLPDFHRDLDALVARAVNCSIGRWESLWDRESFSAVRLETREAILEKIVYVLANPVDAGLVRRGMEWPGLWSNERQLRGSVLALERPKEFFRSHGPLPAVAHLQLHPPPGLEHDAAFVDAVLSELRRAEDRAAAELGRQGRSFLGVARVLAQKPYARPAACEPRRTLNPRVASRNKWRRIEALLRLRDFARAHREALEAWRAGLRDALFPPGTWLMRVQHQARCGAAF
jgi:REP element-mobilizing transposase RayT